MDRGAWHATVHRVTESDTIEQQKQSKQTNKKKTKGEAKYPSYTVRWYISR